MGETKMDTIFQTAVFAGIGYLSGSVLYARVFARLFRKEDILEQSRDHNPGTANAFLYGGFWCGMLTLIFDLLKGFLPVYLFVRYGRPEFRSPLQTALVLAAPVIGHIFPLFYRLKGGKGIAVTFGCLAGLYPVLRPLAAFAFCFIFFSSILKISPHFYRTIFSYVLTLVILCRKKESLAAILGFLVITAAVLLRMFASKEEKGRLEVKLLGGFNTFLRNRRRT